MRNQARGKIAFLLVICATIILLGITIGTYNQIQLELAHCHLDKIRAKMLAHQGITNAIHELKNLSFEEIIDIQLKHTHKNITGWKYHGEDLNGNGLLNRGEDQNNNGILDIETCPINKALKPSLMALDPRTKKPLLVNYGTSSRIGYSGEFTMTYPGGKDIYTLKITDCHSQININGSDNGCKNILNNLGIIVNISSDIPGGALGDYIFNQKTKKTLNRFTVREELKAILSKTSYEKIEPYITVYGQPDQKVIKPSPYKIINGTEILSWKQITPSTLITESRYPININTASKPVIMATIANLSGIYLDQNNNNDNRVKQAFTNRLDKPLGRIETAGLSIGTLKTIDLKIPDNIRIVEIIAERIIEERARYPFTEWEAFNFFCDTILNEEFLGDISTPEGYKTAKARADIIKANANPNTLLNKFNPDRIIYRSIDKSDLINYTTEFCFTPRGYFEIESLGLVLRPSNSGKLIKEAKHLIRSVTKIYEIYSETTQADFSRGKISQQPCQEKQTLETYPQPNINNLKESCHEDGQIALATLKNINRESVTFAHSFDNTNKADISLGNPYPINLKSDETSSQSVFHGGNLYPDGIYSDYINCPTYESPNNFVDGITFERLYGKKQFLGSISLWIKPNYYQTSIKPRTIFSVNKTIDNDLHSKYNYHPIPIVFSLIAFPKAFPYTPQTDDLSASLRISPSGKYIWFWDLDLSIGKQSQEYIISNNDTEDDNHHKWIHIGIAWNTHPPILNTMKLCPACETPQLKKTNPSNKKTGWLTGNYCRHCINAAEISGTNIYPSDVFSFCINGNDSMSTYIGRQPELFPPDIRQQLDFSSNNSIRFGESHKNNFWNFPGDFTIDEISINMIDNVTEAKKIFQEEFTAGRYYPEQGIFTSGTIHIKKISSSGIKIIPTWTVYYPQEWNKKSRKIQFRILTAQESPLMPFTEKQGSTIKIQPDKNNALLIKYQFLFESRNNTTVHHSPLTETPFLDDISMLIFKDEHETLEEFTIEK